MVLLLLPAIAWAETKVPSRPPGAQRVFDALDALRLAAQSPAPAALRSIAVTDADLNDYITYRIKSERAQALRDLLFKVLPENRVEGMIFLDLGRLGAPGFLGTSLHFYFAGRLRTENARIKLDVEELFLEHKSVPVFLLNLAFYIASKTQKHGPAGLADWYRLPLGIRDIVTQAGLIIFRY